MIDFWLLSALLILVGMLTLIWPLWRTRQQKTVDRTALNVALYEERVAELTAQREQGDITAEQQEQAQQEASRLLLEDTANADTGVRPRKRGGWWQLLVPALLLPVAVVWLYTLWGNPEGLALQRELQQTSATQSLPEYIERMERIVRVQPQNGEAWYMLGRAYMSAQQPEMAAAAFGNSLERVGERPEVLAQLAQARYFAAGNQLDAAAVEALDRALELDAQEPTALGLMGIAAFEGRDYTGAIGYWTRLLAGMPEDSEGAATIRGGIERAERRLGGDEGERPQDDPQAVIRVRLELAANLLENVSEEAVVFLFARDPQGQPMPLVARRFNPDELPADVVLGNADAMLPGVRLEPGQQVELIARLSPDGNVMQGSHEGRLATVTVGAEDAVTLRIDQALE
ncbi:c-type cytochrome biogenesis protein CcmI [Halopseudomonas salegens]|uniref:Cytochrome c-type biogenesis protein CcmH n=1 Tax=Halopseudomonas salegens TaxID=1434072 RepID=A0A1H2FXI9_9GAMM|nr:c-type cytochrome biogenesis protein CcmI [Halopseudomonas salegens]SDU12087.1 cytochrome c-type biogenesis protein CcmH [Halopseudomonas salegens]